MNVLALSPYIKEIRGFGRDAIRLVEKKKDNHSKAATIFFKNIAKIKPTGKSGSRTWMAIAYANAIKEALESLGVKNIYVKDSDLNVQMKGFSKRKRVDMIVVHNNKNFIIEIKSSATLNAILSAAGEFLIFKNVGGVFESQKMKDHKIKLNGSNTSYLLFSGYCDKSYSSDIGITQKAFKIKFEEVSWFRNRKLLNSGDWSYQKSIDEMVQFFKNIVP